MSDKKPTDAEIKDNQESLIHLHKMGLIDFNKDGVGVTLKGLDVTEAFIMLDEHIGKPFIEDTREDTK